MIMIRNGAQVYIMMLYSNRQSGGVGVNPSRPAAPEALVNNNQMSSGTPEHRRLASSRGSFRYSLVPSISPLDTKGDKCLLLRGVWKTM
jgi:hypothetical protein